MMLVNVALVIIDIYNLQQLEQGRKGSHINI